MTEAWIYLDPTNMSDFFCSTSNPCSQYKGNATNDCSPQILSEP